MAGVRSVWAATSIVAVIVGLLPSFAVSSAAATRPVERLRAPFAGGPTAVTTSTSYRGKVTITVSGYGQAAGTSCSDAFYLFAESSGTRACDRQTTPRPAAEFGLAINGRPATAWIGTRPAYTGNHLYRFTVTLPDEPVKLTFGVGDTYVVDNSGAYRIKVRAGGRAQGPRA